MYNWKLQTGHTTYEGCSVTLNDALDKMVKSAHGKTERDFHVNGHHMNEEFGLWISDGKVIHDDGTEFVAMNEWYEKLGVTSPSMDGVQVMAQVLNHLDNCFRPQPTRGSAPTNPATLLAKGEGL